MSFRYHTRSASTSYLSGYLLSHVDQTQLNMFYNTVVRERHYWRGIVNDLYLLHSAERNNEMQLSGKVYYKFKDTKVNRNVQGVPQLQATANPGPRGIEISTEINACKINKQMSHDITKPTK